MRRVLPILGLALALGACGYFNSLYNARRQFSDAERARARGETGTAQTAYTGTIEKAAKSYRKYPKGRWADDALYLIARSRFQLGEFEAARAAFNALLSMTSDGGLRAGAHAFAGATALRLAERTDALAHLDSAVARLDDDAPLNGFARLWRARAHAALGDITGAWADLDAVTSVHDSEYGAVQLERIGFAIETHDSARLASAFAGILSSRDARQRLDTLNVFALQATPWLGAQAVRAFLAEPPGSWPSAPRDSLALLRAQIAVRAGDTLDANRELMDLAEHAVGPTAAVARVMVARSRLRSLQTLEQLAAVRSLLLPAITVGEAQMLIRTIRLVDVMVRRSAQTGQPLAVFAAAETARDELGAPNLARTLFKAYADIGVQTPWAAKALLAAIALDPAAPDANDLRERLHALAPNPYTQVVNGESAQDAYDTAEERLTRSLIALKSEATQLAQQQENVVSQVIATLDSITAAARTDTLRAACGLMLDTLAITGIRADSVRIACMRSDSIKVAAYLIADTVSWRPDTTRANPLTTRRRGARTTRDTIIK